MLSQSDNRCEKQIDTKIKQRLRKFAYAITCFASLIGYSNAQADASINVENIAIVEGDTANITVSIPTAATTGGISVIYTPINNTTIDADYSLPDDRVLIPAGQTSGTIPITAVTDANGEGIEDFTLRISEDLAVNSGFQDATDTGTGIPGWTSLIPTGMFEVRDEVVYSTGGTVPTGNLVLEVDSESQGYQDVPTVIGREYTVSFKVARRIFGGPSVADVTVSALDGTTVIASDTITKTTANSPTFSLDHEEFNFIATSTTTRLSFTTTNTNNVGLIFDDLSIIPVVADEEVKVSILDTDYGPGGTNDGLGLWLKADTGVTGTANVTTWADQSGNGHDVSQLVATNQPALEANSLNFNPVVDFDGTNDQLTNPTSPFASGLSDETNIFFVAREDVRQVNSIFGFNAGDTNRFQSHHLNGDDTAFFDIGTNLAPDRISGATGISASEPHVASYFNSVANGNQSIVINSAIIASDASGESQSLGVTSIGAATITNTLHFNGDIAEFIAYDTDNNAQTKDIIQSYLAIKYGITLDDGTVAYKNSSGADIWSVDTTYDTDIFGIAKDDNQALDQQISKSVNPRAILTLSTDTNFSAANGTHASLTNNQALMMASDGNSATTAFTTTGAPPSFALIGETWKVKNTGAVTGIGIQIDVDDIANDIPTFAGNLYLVKGSDLSTATPVQMTNAGSGLWTLDNIDFADGDLVSFVVDNAVGVNVEFSNATAVSSDESTANNFPTLFVSGVVNVTATVEVTQTGGTASSGSDYNAYTAQTINIPAGTYNGTIADDIPIPAPTLIQDFLVEGNETIIFSLTNPSAGVSAGDADSTDGTENPHTYTITDDDIPSLTNSTVTVIVNNAVANNSATDTLLATVRDATNNALQGVIVTFVQPTNVTFSSTTCVTDATGQCSVTATSSVAGNYSSAVSIATGAVPGSPVNFSFIAGPINAAQSGLTTSSTTQPVGTSATITATIRDANNNPIASEVVNLTTTAGSLSATTCTTNATGVCTVTINNTTAESATVSATTSTGSVAINPITTTWTAGAIDATQSDLTVSSTTQTVGTSATITASVNDTNGNPIASEVVNLATTAGSLSATTCTTNATGVCTVTINNTTAESATVTATTSTGSVVITPSVTTAWTAGAISAAQSGLTVSSTTQPVGTNATITATIRDANNNPIASEVVNLTTTAGSLSAATCTTNATGICTVTINNTTAESATVTATTSTGSVVITPSVTTAWTFSGTTPPSPTLTPDIGSVGDAIEVTAGTCGVEYANGTAEFSSSPTGQLNPEPTTVPLDSNGDFAGFTLDTSRATGNYSIIMTCKDIGGNAGPSVNPIGPYIADHDAPPTAIINPIQTDTNPITGTAEPGSTVDLTGVVCDNAPVITDDAGNWSCDVTGPLAPSTPISATVTDIAGNVSPETQTTVTDSSTTSEAPSINTVDDDDLMITGKAKPGATIDVSPLTCDNAPVVADATGKWSCDITNSGTQLNNSVITVTATEPGKAASPASSTNVVDSTEVTDPPTVMPTAGDFVAGSCEVANAQVTVFNATTVTELCTTTADASGDYSCAPLTPTPAHGDELSVVCTDLTTNEPSPATKVTVDQVFPAPPVINMINTNTDSITGTAEPGSEIDVSPLTCNNVPVIADAAGNWNCDVTGPLTAPTEVRVRAIDPSGNTSDPAVTTVTDEATTAGTPSINVTDNNDLAIQGKANPGAEITTSVPCLNAPVIADSNGNWSCDIATPVTPGTQVTAIAKEAGKADSPESSTIAIDNTAMVPPPVVNPTNGTSVAGSCNVPNSTVQVFNDDSSELLCTTTADATGDYSCSPINPSPANNDRLNVVCTNSTTGEPSPPSIITVDSVPPEAPLVDAIVIGAPVTGTGEPGAEVTVSTPTSSCTAIVQANGSFSCDLSPTPLEGESVTIIQTDPSGNVSQPTTDTVNAPPTTDPIQVVETGLKGGGSFGVWMMTITGLLLFRRKFIVDVKNTDSRI